VSVSTSANDRRVLLDGCFNFRDVGGYPTKYGSTVRWRRFYRSGGPLDLSPSDIETVRRLRLATVIDLRTAEEVASHPGFRQATATANLVHLPMTDLLPAPDELARWTDATFVADQYFSMLAEATPMVVEAIAMLTDPSAYPVLVHCSAGKDRTGVLTAVVLGLLGVDREAIVADYALSRDGMERLVGWLRENAAASRDTVEQFLPAILAADPATMHSLLDRIVVEWGSFSGLADALGVGSAPEYLRARLLTPGR
jgi:protein-tyrosine phosphatase